MSDGHIRAPFSPEQVLALNRWQTLGYVHEFTCGSRGDGRHGDGQGALVATVRGWICPFCDYTQDWAHAHMATPEPPPNPVAIWSRMENVAMLLAGDKPWAQLSPQEQADLRDRARIALRTPPHL